MNRLLGASELLSMTATEHRQSIILVGVLTSPVVAMYYMQLSYDGCINNSARRTTIIFCRFETCLCSYRLLQCAYYGTTATVRHSTQYSTDSSIIALL